MHAIFYVLLFIAFVINAFIWRMEYSIWQRLLDSHPSAAISLGLADRFWGSPVVRIRITQFIWNRTFESVHDAELSRIAHRCLKLWRLQFAAVLLVIIAGAASVAAGL